MKTSYALSASLLFLVMLTGCPEEDTGSDPTDPADMVSDLATTPDAAADMTEPADDQGEQVADLATPEDMAPDLTLPSEDMAQDQGSVEEDMAPDMDGEDDMGGEFPPVTTDPLGGGRPATVVLPTGFDNAEPVPLVILLHGYSATGAIQDSYFKISPQVDQKNFVFVYPEGTRDAQNNQFWNATDACCDAFRTGVDDVGYIRGIIEEAFMRFNIDRGRVYLLGHSNGGFMSFRMACDVSEYVTGIFSLAGASYKEVGDCQPSEPVHIVQMHGTDDPTIQYGGGSAYPTAPLYPSAPDTVGAWAGYNGCTPGLVDLMVGDVANAATLPMQVQGFDDCPANGSVELWTIQGGNHIPTLPDSFADVVLDHLFAFDRTP